jgi:predicted RNA-binding Zn-ribbon protein involved in translation (DUF1610 family)
LEITNFGGSKMDSIKLEMKGNNTKIWKDTTLENFYVMLKITRSILAERMSFSNDPYEPSLIDEYSDHRALWTIKAGGTVSTPVLEFRLICPNCGIKFMEACGALSRYDNKTKLCSKCGMKEAIESLEALKGGGGDWK